MYHSLQEAMKDENLYSTAVAAVMFDLFGVEWISWEPETIEMELRSVGMEITPPLQDKIQAVSTLLSTNLYHKSFEAWTNVNRVFNFHSASGDLFTPAGLEDVMWGCTEARLLEGPEQYDSESFSSNIGAYAGTLLSQEGITRPPSILSFAIQDDSEGTDRDDALMQDDFMFKAYWDSHNNNVDIIEKETIAKVKDLINQLKSLPLKNGDTGILSKIAL